MLYWKSSNIVTPVTTGDHTHYALEQDWKQQCFHTKSHPTLCCAGSIHKIVIQITSCMVVISVCQKLKSSITACLFPVETALLSLDPNGEQHLNPTYPLALLWTLYWGQDFSPYWVGQLTSNVDSAGKSASYTHVASLPPLFTATIYII